MLKAYLNQTAEYRPLAGSDEYGGPVFGEAVAVKCRRQAKTQTVLERTGQAVRTQTVYLLDRPVCEGDLLDGRAVMEVSLMTDLSGRTVGCRAVV